MVCGIKVQALNRKSLVAEVAGAVVRRQLAIRNLASDSDEAGEQTVMSFSVEVPDLFVLARLLKDLERLAGVVLVQRTDVG